MHLKRVRVPNFRVLKDVDITFEPDLVPRIFPLGSVNGGGKSTLLQLIFTLLHCCADEERIPYLQNILDRFEIEDNSGYRDLATIDLVVQGTDIELKFFLCDRKYIENYLEPDISDNNTAINIQTLALLAAKERLEGKNPGITEIINIVRKIDDINNTLNELNNLYSLQFFINYQNANSTASAASMQIAVKEFKKKLTDIIDRYEQIFNTHNLIRPNAIEQHIYLDSIRQNNFLTAKPTNVYNECQNMINQVRKLVLESRNKVNTPIKKILATEFISKKDPSRAFIIFTKNCENQASETLLVCSYLGADNILVDRSSFINYISSNIFLAAPITQVFHFLPKSDRLLLFRNKNIDSPRSENTNYYNTIDTAKLILHGFFPYDTFSVDFLIDTFESAIDNDIKQISSIGSYGTSYPKLVVELEKILANQKVNVDLKNGSITLTKTDDRGNTIQLYPEDLSHGELKRLSLYVWLKYNNIDNAIVLMDEVEIALHPDWQYGIINDLQTWAPNNQYILATHSYEMCQALTPAHVKEIEPNLLKQK